MNALIAYADYSKFLASNALHIGLIIHVSRKLNKIIACTHPTKEKGGGGVKKWA